MIEALHNTLKFEISSLILKALDCSFPDHGIEKEEIYSQLGDAPKLEMGQMSFGCFILAKKLKIGPPQIATKLLENLPDSSLVKEAKAQGPYINIFFNNNALGEMIINSINSLDFFKKDLLKEKKNRMFEYSQPNTHKELHVGHMRNLCLGNALVRLNRYVGHEVHAVTYPGDVGTHVAKCLWYLDNHNKTPAPVGENKGTWLGEIYANANNLLEEQKGSEQEEKNSDELTRILKELESGSGKFYDMWQETRQWSIDLFKKSYQWADVEFDKWYYESDVDSPSLERVNKLYEEGKLIKDKGAIGMDLSDDKLGFCMLVKSDGNGLYATKDIELAYRKFEEFHTDESLYIVDKRQAHHFSQFFKVLEKLGFERAKDCHHLQYDFVELPSGAMSSRKGNVIPLMHLIDQMEETIKDKYLSRYADQWTQDEIDSTATMIANGAIKYGMIRMDNNKKIVFDMNEWLKLDGETGPYLQYVHARIATLLKKIDTVSTELNWELLSTKQEKNLMIFLSKFNDVACTAANQYKTSAMTSYLFDLGKLFNSFYAECSIAKAETEILKTTRLSLTRATGLVMKKGLESLGISAPEKM